MCAFSFVLSFLQCWHFWHFHYFFSPSLIQWGHLKSVGKWPAVPSLILSTGMGIPYCSHRTVLSSCPKAKAWQIKTSSSTNWWEKESSMHHTGSGELLWWRKHRSWDAIVHCTRGHVQEEPSTGGRSIMLLLEKPSKILVPVNKLPLSIF